LSLEPREQGLEPPIGLFSRDSFVLFSDPRAFHGA
jgi:hypothetical protein